MAYQNYYNPYPNVNYQNPYFAQQIPQQTQQQGNYAYNSQQLYNQQLNSGFQWVQGEAAAKAYHVDPGQTVLLMDSDNPVLYYKSTDQSGRPIPMIIYDLVERKSSEPISSNQTLDLSEYVKRDEIEEIIQNAVVQSIEQKMSEIQFTATTAPTATSTKATKAK